MQFLNCDLKSKENIPPLLLLHFLQSVTTGAALGDCNLISIIIIIIMQTLFGQSSFLLKGLQI